ncbi:hypothetical protein HY638_00015 [Candidatus Woesearchaeota archaeon]|nr:hypothetical protein [Candidatus Woesearchaeota archaeon]
MKKILPLLFSLALAGSARAHCPLCTVGAAAAAGGAAYLGVSNMVIGIFIGAFAVSMGWWVSKLIKRQFLGKMPLIIAISFATTIIPLMPLIKGDYPLFISLAGDYGSLLNRTYLISLFLAGSIIGGIVVCITPWLSSRIGEYRGKMVPYQGIILTFVLLVLTSATIEVVRWVK